MFKKKFHPVTGQYLSTRARIAPHGFRQIVNRDYNPDKIAAPTLSIEALHLFAMFSINKCRYKRARDAVSAFTTVDLDELIILELPVGIPQQEGKCMKLGKMCYGLKQAAWMFHDKVRKTLLDIGYQPTLFDACLYFILVTDGDRQYLVLTAVYVDNFNTAAEREEDAVHYDADIGKRIDSRIEDPNIILGIVFVETADTLQLNMKFQCEAVLERFGMLDANVKKTPLPASLVLKPATTELQTTESRQYPYPEVVGSVMWIIRCTLVSAKFACNTLCAHMTKWDTTHVAAAQHMLKYIKHMKNEGLTFRRKPTLDRLSMRVFCDANFAGEPPESTHAAMRSTSAFQIVLDGIGTILFLSKQQTTVAKSTFEAEYRCASHAAQVQQGYINVLGQLGEVVQCPTPFAIDNTATMRAITTQATSF